MGGVVTDGVERAQFSLDLCEVLIQIGVERVEARTSGLLRHVIERGDSVETVGGGPVVLSLRVANGVEKYIGVLG